MHIIFLENSSTSIETVALSLGYADTSHFTRAFKRWMGVTPKYYRTQLKLKNSVHDKNR